MLEILMWLDVIGSVVWSRLFPGPISLIKLHKIQVPGSDMKQHALIWFDTICTDRTDRRFPLHDLESAINSQSRRIPGLYDLAHVAAWGRIICMIYGTHISWVGSVLYRSCTTYHDDRLGYRWSRSWSLSFDLSDVWTPLTLRKISHTKTKYFFFTRKRCRSWKGLSNGTLRNFGSSSALCACDSSVAHGEPRECLRRRNPNRTFGRTFT